MKRLIKKILKEDRRQMYLDKIVQIMKNDYPLIKNMELYGFTELLSEEELKYVFSHVLKQNVGSMRLGNQYKYLYNKNNKEIYVEDSDGFWSRSEYNSLGKRTYKENNLGRWVKVEYDEDGRRIYYEDSEGIWEKYEYNEDGLTIYFEDSMSGVMLDYR